MDSQNAPTFLPRNESETMPKPKAKRTSITSRSKTVGCSSASEIANELVRELFWITGINDFAAVMVPKTIKDVEAGSYSQLEFHRLATGIIERHKKLTTSRAAEFRACRAHLKAMVKTVKEFLDWIDVEMKKPSDVARGKRIAFACNSLEMQKDLAERFGIGKR